MSNEEKTIETTTAEKLVEVHGEEKKYVIIEWMKQHPGLTILGFLTGIFIIVIAGYGTYKFIKGRLYKVVTEEPTEENFEDKTNEPTENV